MEYQTNAPAGAALLNERKPGWFRGFDFMRFRIHDIWDCVLGQAYGSYAEGLAALFGPGLTDDSDPFHFAKAQRHGFNSDGNGDRLQLEWIHVISGLLLDDEGN